MNEYRLNVASLKEGRISPLQIRVIVLSVLLGLVDGYDTLAVAYAAPIMRTALDLSSTVLGWVFSSALIGGIAGMFLGGPIADRVGRRPTLIAQVLVFGVFTLLSAYARSAEELLLYRFFAGLGLGLALTVTFTIVSEYAPSRFKVTAIALITIGYSAGAGLGGLVGAWLIKSYSWHAIFYVGGAAAFCLAIAFLIALPESLEFLVNSSKSDDRVNELARKMRPEIYAQGIPVLFAEKDDVQSIGLGELFRPGRLSVTLLLWTVFFMNLIELYGVQQWLPTLIHQSGVDVSSAVSAGAVLQIGAILGGIIFSHIIDKWKQPFKLFPYLFLAGGLAFSSLSYAGGSTLWTMSSVVLLGAFVMGTQIALNGVATMVYPPSVRATGISWAVAVGRIGGASGPVLSGFLLQQGFSASQILLMGAVPATIAFAAALCLSSNEAFSQPRLREALNHEAAT